MAGKKKKKSAAKKAARSTSRKKTARKGKTRRRRGVASGWTKKQLSKLHDCWKATHTRKECLARVAEEIPDMPPPSAWALVRRLSKTDQAWMLTAQHKEQEKERRRQEREQTRVSRMRKRQAREAARERRDRRTEIKELLRDEHVSKVASLVGEDFFFCPDLHQQVCILSCVFRIFAAPSEYGFSHGGACGTCRRMDKHMPALEAMLEKEGAPHAKQESERDTAGTNRRQTEEQEATA